MGLGCHLHERGRGLSIFGSQDSLLHFDLAANFMKEVAAGHLSVSHRGADDLNPILVTYMSRVNEARIRSGHHLQNDLCLARLRSAPRLCTLTSPWRWAYVPEPWGYLPWRSCMTAPRFSTWLPPS